MAGGCFWLKLCAGSLELWLLSNVDQTLQADFYLRTTGYRPVLREMKLDLSGQSVGVWKKGKVSRVTLKAASPDKDTWCRRFKASSGLGIRSRRWGPGRIWTGLKWFVLKRTFFTFWKSWKIEKWWKKAHVVLMVHLTSHNDVDAFETLQLLAACEHSRWNVNNSSKVWLGNLKKIQRQVLETEVLKLQWRQ